MVFRLYTRDCNLKLMVMIIWAFSAINLIDHDLIIRVGCPRKPFSPFTALCAPMAVSFGQVWAGAHTCPKLVMGHKVQ